MDDAGLVREIVVAPKPLIVQLGCRTIGGDATALDPFARLMTLARNGRSPCSCHLHFLAHVGNDV
jgi:hypothetical protein